MDTKHKKGSEWRKWDLHFHTQSSHDYQDKSITDDIIIQTLIDNNIKVAVITDHHIIDANRIQNLQKLAGDRIVILPGIEFCSELGGSESIHFIGIFPENSDISSVWTTLQGKLELTPADLQKKGGYENIQCDLIDTCDIIHELGGITSIHAGTKTNTVENIKNNLLAKMQQKKRILSNCIDILELGKLDDQDSYDKKVFPNIGFKLPMVICSDNHDIKEYVLKHNCWIKADVTFKGLKQILNEQDRVFIGTTPLIHAKVQNNRTKYINKLAIKPIDKYDGKYGRWFQNVEIPLNHELVAIIGNKGSGKSAIADIIALCGNYKNQNDFSFLKRDRFRDGKHANNFEATLTWESGVSNTKILSNDNTIEDIETIKYLPQGYFERLTNDFNSIQEFRKEIESIVFTHINGDDKIGFSSFEELIRKRKESIAHDIHIIKEKLDEINKSIFEKEKKLNIAYKNSIDAQIKKKKEELSALIEPIEVKNPNDDPQNAEKNKEINNKIAELKTSISKLETDIQETSKQKREVLQEINDLKGLRQKLKSKEEELLNFATETKDFLEKYNLPINDILTFRFEYTKLDDLLSGKESLLKSHKTHLGELPSETDGFESLSIQLSKKNKELETIQKTLGEEDKKYQQYLLDKKNWEANKNKITGNEEAPNTLKYFEKELKYITECLQNELITERNSRIEITKSIYEKMEVILDIYRSVKSTIDSIISENSDLLGQYKINIDASFNIKMDFQKNFLNYISLNKSGTYYGKENAENQVNELIKSTDFDDIKQISLLLSNIVDSFFNDKRNNKQMFIDNQVENVVELYNYLFSLDFLDYNYELKQGEKNLEQLSPGEKGALLLIFYLLLDNNDIPLIIDQPEDNLDNHSVANILVPFIKKAKAKRQIILVTHNPNLAVVADAEQVIYVELDKEQDNTFDFKSGSIENPVINECIVKVLEGAMPAFNKRKQKYYE
jgi:ABC-type lipoprotein export system ATPase subunit